MRISTEVRERFNKRKKHKEYWDKTELCANEYLEYLLEVEESHSGDSPKHIHFFDKDFYEKLKIIMFKSGIYSLEKFIDKKLDIDNEYKKIIEYTKD